MSGRPGFGGAGGEALGDVFHRLGVMAAIAALVLWTGLELVRRRRERAVRRRVVDLLVGVGAGAAWRDGESARLPGTWPRDARASVARLMGGGAARGTLVRAWAGPLGVLAAAYVLIGGVPGAVAGLVAAYGARRWARRRKPQRARPGAESVDPELPLAADLLAACLSAGAGPREAAGAVGESLDGPVGRRLAQIAAELRLGGEPAEVWGRLGAIPGAAGLARCLERAASSGAPAAGPVGRVAERCRAERARTTAARARRAGVLITGPLGLCFLPAFLAAGVAPVVIGLAGGLLKH
ncbi:type II secretion system F family protein [Streptomyces melanogenes]|uniref:Type II secretion system F family protein n=1 Tax=Streptomyces melanogenes TaxID=67326 RepID=A0ABZ1XNV5_9ACTN|nr:type II secretion system F family protein [Streptomyces melanogenes]